MKSFQTISSNVSNKYKMKVQFRFLLKDWNHSPNSHQKIWRTNDLRTGALLGVISDIHRVCTNPEDPMAYGCQKWSPLRHLSSSCMFFKFSDVNLGSDFDSFWENLTCTKTRENLLPCKFNVSLNIFFVFQTFLMILRIKRKMKN